MRLEVSRRADLATRALLELDPAGQRLKSTQLSEAIGTTPGFLSQVLAPLVARGWVRSDPGPTGGYSVTARLQDVSVLDVIEAIEGPTDVSRCVLEDRPCDGEGPCALHVPWTRARQQLLRELASTPMSTLMQRRSPR